jgi:hypothetical protein
VKSEFRSQARATVEVSAAVAGILATALAFYQAFGPIRFTLPQIAGLWSEPLTICAWGPSGYAPGNNCRDAVRASTEINAVPEPQARVNAQAACVVFGRSLSPPKVLQLARVPEPFVVDPRPLTCGRKFDASDWNGSSFVSSPRFVCKNPGASPVLASIQCEEPGGGSWILLTVLTLCTLGLVALAIKGVRKRRRSAG